MEKRKVFIKKTVKHGYAGFSVRSGAKGKGKELFAINGWDNPTALRQMTDTLYRKIEENNWYVAGDNYSEE